MVRKGVCEREKGKDRDGYAGKEERGRNRKLNQNEKGWEGLQSYRVGKRDAVEV